MAVRVYKFLPSTSTVSVSIVFRIYALLRFNASFCVVMTRMVYTVYKTEHFCGEITIFSSNFLWTFVILLRDCILADRTNGRAYATVLRPSVAVCSSLCNVCIVAKRYVLEQKLLLTAYRK